MSRPKTCLYCKGTGEGPGSPCGFCENGKPLDTEADWENTWGKLDDIRKRDVECGEKIPKH